MANDKWVCCPACGDKIKLFKLSGAITGHIEQKCRCCKGIVRITGDGTAEIVGATKSA